MNTNTNQVSEIFLASNQEIITGQFIAIDDMPTDSQANCSGHCQSGTCMAE